MSDRPVLAAFAWPSNAHLIADVRRLGYLHREWKTLDCTFGMGTWWKLWRPDELVAHDIRLDGVDFRRLPHADGEFRVVAFDPPYVAPGGRKTSTIGPFNLRYGLVDVPRTPEGLHEMNVAGMAECVRVLELRGFLLVKCADYVTSGKLYPGTHRTLSAALGLGLTLQDRLEHIGHVRAQPKRTRADGQPVRQQHARRNLSTLLVLQKRV